MVSEPTLNVLLAELLARRGLVGGAELVVRCMDEVRKPDVLMLVSGSRVNLEGKIDRTGAREELAEKCPKRVEEGIADIAVAVIYKLTRDIGLLFSNEEVKEVLEASRYDVRVWGPGEKGAEPLPQLGLLLAEPGERMAAAEAAAEPLLQWVEVDIDGLVRILRSAINEIASRDLLADAIERLRATLDAAAAHFLTSDKETLKSVADNLAPIVQVRKPQSDDERLRTVKMAMLVLADATIFYNVIAPRWRLDTLDSLKQEHKTTIAAMKAAFSAALSHNYEPVFDLSLAILWVLPAIAEFSANLVAEVSFYISSSTPLLLKHDLMGRVYHKLLFADIAKHLATYYTSVPAAWLLARLAVETKGSPWEAQDWSETDLAKDFRVADFACGSGTLLSAAYRALEDKHVTDCARAEKEPRIQSLHADLLEQAIYGLDVVMYAAHITTLTLALHNPNAFFRQNNVWAVPLGSKAAQLGSIELLHKDSRISRMTSVSAEGETPVRQGIAERVEEEIKFEPNSFDLVIMNPPFARSCGDNLLFGSIGDKRVRAAMKNRLAELLDQADFSGVGQAGLGAVFVLLADKFVKKRGRIAFVLPRNFLSGLSWERPRQLLTKRTPAAAWVRGGYHLESAIISVEPQSYNFSENTDLSECLFVALKLEEGEAPGKTLAVVLHRKPRTVFESLILSKHIRELLDAAQNSDVFDILTNTNASAALLKIGTESVGRAYALNADLVQRNVDNWGRLVAYAHPELTATAYTLRTLHEFSVPGGISVHIPLKPLTPTLAEVGPDRRQIHTCFERAPSGVVPALWGKTKSMNQLEVEPNAQLAWKPGHVSEQLLRMAAQPMVAERVRLNTTPLIALCCRKPALSNVWWPVKIKSLDSISQADADQILALWFNSTPGLLLYLSELEVTEGPWAGIKKAALERLPVLDLSTLDARQAAGLAELWAKLSRWKAPLLLEQFRLATEGKGWRFELDSTLLSALAGKSIQLADLRTLYTLLYEEAKLWQ